ncbi:MAG: hypothetical protein ABID09_04055 [Candidatus Omnitrophota bacterium]
MPKTRFVRYIIGILSCAVVALFYTHQEIEAVKTGFLINKHAGRVSFLLDQRRSLVYNLSQLESPKRVEDTLCINEIVLCMPKIENKHYTIGADVITEDEIKPKRAESVVAKLFDRFAPQAEAEVLE